MNFWEKLTVIIYCVCVDWDYNKNEPKNSVRNAILEPIVNFMGRFWRDKTREEADNFIRNYPKA